MWQCIVPLSFAALFCAVGCDDHPSPKGARAVPPAGVIELAGRGGDQAGGHAGPQPRRSGDPAPIQGGTLLVSHDDRLAVAADPDRDRIAIVDLEQAQVRGILNLMPGDEPGRLVEDDEQRVHVVLRQAGAVTTLDLSSGEIVDRRAVCAAPEGIAFDPASKDLWVACAEGLLVRLPAHAGDVAERVRVEADLRDVIVADGALLVTRFKHAELLRIDREQGVLSRARPALTHGPFASRFGAMPSHTGAFEAAVAWRTLRLPDGRFVMVHQRDQVDPIDLPAPMGGAAQSNAVPQMAFGTGATTPALPVAVGIPTPATNPYGSRIGCDSIVVAGVTYLDQDGGSQVEGPTVPGLVLPVDAAVSPDGRFLAVASAGSFNARPNAVESFGAVIMPLGSMGAPFAQMGAAILPAQSSDADAGIADVDGGIDEPQGRSDARCLMPGRDMQGFEIPAGQVVGVAFDGKNRLVMQTRDPNRIRVVALDSMRECTACTSFAIDVDLGGASRRTLGHDLFHANAGAGLACASCHPGGTDDGRSWDFKGLGLRRTQTFNMGVGDTLPLHWDGEFANLNQLLLDVFVQRMGGGSLSLLEGEQLAEYLDTLRPRTAPRSASDEAVLRGKQLFDSTEVGCSGCHSGAKFTSNQSVDVGTGGVFQVPSLVGLAYRAPYLHNGCAATLRDRFEPSCGGTAHGNTASLSAAQRSDLIAYLESL